MGGINGIGFGMLGRLSPLDRELLDQLSPEAVSMLNELARSGWDDGRYVSDEGTGRLPFLKGLARNLLVANLDALGETAHEGIDRLVYKLVEKADDRMVPYDDYGMMRPPSIFDRITDYRRDMEGLYGGARSIYGDRWRGIPSRGGDVTDSILAGMPPEPEQITGRETPEELARKQAVLQKYAMMMQALTNMLNAIYEMKKGIIEKFRV